MVRIGRGIPVRGDGPALQKAKEHGGNGPQDDEDDNHRRNAPHLDGEDALILQQDGYFDRTDREVVGWGDEVENLPSVLSA